MEVELGNGFMLKAPDSRPYLQQALEHHLLGEVIPLDLEIELRANGYIPEHVVQFFEVLGI